MRIRTLLLGLNIGLAGIAVQVAIAQNDWPSYGRDPGRSATRRSRRSIRATCPH